MNSIVIAGSSLVGLLCADILSKNNSVTIIESDLEIGFPANFPGRSKNRLTIENILSNQDLHNLFIKESNKYVNFRSEWFTKLLTHKLAKNNVKIMNRSRISSITQSENNLNIAISGSEQNEKIIQCNIFIDFSSVSFSIIGNNTHQYDIESERIIKPDIPSQQFFVGICLLKDSDKLGNFELMIDRSDDLVEVWYQLGNETEPNQGWIESKTVKAYFNSQLMLLEDYYSRAEEIVNKMVIT